MNPNSALFVFALLAAACAHNKRLSASAFAQPLKIRVPPRLHNKVLPSSPKETELYSSDQLAVKDQLGYVPPNFSRVTARTGLGRKPVAIQTYPLNGGAVRRKSKAKGKLTPFPTLYWLCDPEISRAVADLERRGYVGVLEERLRSDEQYTEQYINAHVVYAEERWQSLTKDDRAMLERASSSSRRNEEDGTISPIITKGMVDMIQYSGIAGRRRPFEPRIKCLHSHYAHYRSGGDKLNIVGNWTHQLLREQFPELDL